MRALVWLAENSWEACIDQARALLPPDARVSLLFVTASDVEELARHAGGERLGRHAPPGPAPLEAISAEQAAALLDAARRRLGRSAELLARRGRVEREVLEACAAADLLVLARDGAHAPGPKSLAHRARFVVDHAPCPVLLLWPQAGAPPGA